MATALKPNEKLICAGEALLRLPNGTLLKGVRQYITADKAAPGAAVPLNDNERLVMVGTVHTDRKASEKRFAEALAGRGRPKFDGTPLFIKETTDTPSGLSAGERKICDAIIGDFMGLLAARERQAVTELT